MSSWQCFSRERCDLRSLMIGFLSWRSLPWYNETSLVNEVWLTQLQYAPLTFPYVCEFHSHITPLVLYHTSTPLCLRSSPNQSQNPLKYPIFDQCLILDFSRFSCVQWEWRSPTYITTSLNLSSNLHYIDFTYFPSYLHTYIKAQPLSSIVH